MSFKAYVKNFYEMQDMAPVQHVLAHSRPFANAALSMYCSREERFLHIQLIVPLLSISKTVVFTLEIAWYISLIIRLTVFANSSVINVPPFLNLS